MRRYQAALLLAVMAACDEPRLYEIDRFPITVDMDGGVPQLLAYADDAGPFRVVLQTGAPWTIFESPKSMRERVVITLQGFQGGSPISRAKFSSVAVLSAPLKGAPFGGASLAGVIGGDVLSSLAIRFDLGKSQITFLPDILGDDSDFGLEGKAVIHAGATGGGKVTLGGGVVDFPATRIVIGTCLDQEPISSASQPGSRGEAFLVLATGVPQTVLSQSAYERATGLALGEDDFDTPLYFPPANEDVFVHMTTLNWLAFADNETSGRGACGEIWANHMIADGANPCGDESSCSAGATVELGDTFKDPRESPIAVAILPDSEDILQTARNEIRPFAAEIDGFLGAGVLRNLVLELDYPHGRLIVRCGDNGELDCVTWPRQVRQ